MPAAPALSASLCLFWKVWPFSCITGLIWFQLFPQGQAGGGSVLETASLSGGRSGHWGRERPAVALGCLQRPVVCCGRLDYGWGWPQSSLGRSQDVSEMLCSFLPIACGSPTPGGHSARMQVFGDIGKHWRGVLFSPRESWQWVKKKKKPTSFSLLNK